MIRIWVHYKSEGNYWIMCCAVLYVSLCLYWLHSQLWHNDLSLLLRTWFRRSHSGKKTTVILSDELRGSCDIVENTVLSAATLGYRFLPTHVRSVKVAGDRREFVGEEWQLGCADAGVQCPLSVFAGLMMSYRFSFLQTNTSAKIRAQGRDQMLHVLPRFAGRLYNWRPLTQNLSVIGVIFSSWKLALFKNPLVAIIVFCDIINSPTCSPLLRPYLLFNNHQRLKFYLLVVKYWANRPHTCPRDSQNTSKPLKTGIICIKWLQPKR